MKIADVSMELHMYETLNHFLYWLRPVHSFIQSRLLYQQVAGLAQTGGCPNQAIQDPLTRNAIDQVWALLHAVSRASPRDFRAQHEFILWSPPFIPAGRHLQALKLLFPQMHSKLLTSQLATGRSSLSGGSCLTIVVRSSTMNLLKSGGAGPLQGASPNAQPALAIRWRSICHTFLILTVVM